MPQNENSDDSDEEIKTNLIPSVNKDLNMDSELMCCRICLSEQELPEHELISPCKCGGSVRYIGLSCLKEWLHGKRYCKKSRGVHSFIWKTLECEICKTPLKEKFIAIDGSERSLLTYELQ